MKFTLIERFKIIREFLRLNRRYAYKMYSCVLLMKAARKVTESSYTNYATLQRSYFKKCFRSKYRDYNMLNVYGDKVTSLRKLAFIKFIILFTFNRL